MMQNRMDQIEAELMTAYLQEEAQVLGVQKADPLVELKQQELQLRQQEQIQDAQQDQMELEFNKQKAQEQAAIQRERIDSTEDIAAMRAQIAMQRTANRRG
jgi:acetyl-CoA carboxylase carboxyltransferase component